MRFSNVSAVRSAATLVLLSAAVAPVFAKPLTPSISSALAKIERDAEAVATGRVSGASVQGPAREIALAWASVEPALLKNGDVLVETKMANTSITAFEADWQHAKSLKSEANEVKSRVADLVAASKE